MEIGSYTSAIQKSSILP